MWSRNYWGKSPGKEKRVTWLGFKKWGEARKSLLNKVISITETPSRKMDKFFPPKKRQKEGHLINEQEKNLDHKKRKGFTVGKANNCCI